jgi:hypothetical protein
MDSRGLSLQMKAGPRIEYLRAPHIESVLATTVARAVFDDCTVQPGV